MLHTVPVPVKEIVLEPKVRVLVALADEANVPVDNVKLFKSNVPDDKVVALVVPVVKASCKVTEPLVVLIPIG